MTKSRREDNKKLTRVISTKLSVEDYKTFRILTNLTYRYGRIKQDSPSEMLRYLISPVVELLRKQPDFYSTIISVNFHKLVFSGSVNNEGGNK
jgi:hypothetical protein